MRLFPFRDMLAQPTAVRRGERSSHKDIPMRMLTVALAGVLAVPLAGQALAKASDQVMNRTPENQAKHTACVNAAKAKYGDAAGARTQITKATIECMRKKP